MAGKIQITGGAFQDFEGNVLANGYLTMQLSHDEQEAVDPGEVVAGLILRVPLDANGNVAGTVYVWPNDQLNPAFSFYIVNAFTRSGILAWAAPQFQTVTGSGPFDIGTWIPNNPPTGGAPVGSILLQTNGTNNSDQALLNLAAGTGITLVNDAGTTTITGASGWPGNWIGCNAAGVNLFSYGSGANIGMDMQPYSASALAVTRTASATEPCFVPVQTNTLTASGGLIDTSLNITLGILNDWFAKMAIVGTTDSRYFFGCSDQTEASAGNAFFSDTPDANFVGFRFSTNADTTVQAICQTSDSDQTVVDTGVAPAAVNLYEIIPTESGATITFYINKTLVATIDTNVPATSVAMTSILTGDFMDNGSSNEQFNFYYVYALLNA